MVYRIEISTGCTTLGGCVQRKGNVRGKSIWAPRHWAGVYGIRIGSCTALQLHAIRLSEKENPHAYNIVIGVYSFPTLTFS